MALSKTEGFRDAIEMTNTRERADSRDKVSENSSKSVSRVLTQEEMDKLGAEVLVSDFKQIKLEEEAQKNWDLFYKRNTTNFFKDRHWTTREFEELKACREVSRWMINPGRVTEVAVRHNYKAPSLVSQPSSGRLSCATAGCAASGLQLEAQRLVLLEAGCGVGNCIFPLLEDDLNLFVYACDFSPRAVEFVKVWSGLIKVDSKL